MDSNIINGLRNGFINSSVEANIDYIPRILTNNPAEGEKVLTDIEKELDTCDEFMFCVAFLNMSGYQILINSLNKTKANNIKGTIIVSQYQNFTEPKALRKLKQYKNIDLRIITEDAGNMHSKGYIFKHGNEYTIIVGSSNLTQSALLQNKEWNVKLNSTLDGNYTKMCMHEFNEMYSLSTSVTEEYIEDYEKLYNLQKKIAKTGLINNIP